MDRLQTIEVFTVVVETGSLAAAGRRLGLSPPAVTRAVAALESRLRTRLLNRTTRSLSLTEAGARYLETARRVLQELDEAERDAAGEASEPLGHLTVTAPVTFGRMHVAPVLATFLDAHQRITGSLLLLDRVVDLVAEGIDVAVRIAHLTDSTQIARRIGEVRMMVAASPAYLARAGTPAHPRELADHRITAFATPFSRRDWHFRDAGRPLTVSLRACLEVNDAMAAIAVVEAGHGLLAALSYQLDPSLAAGRLVPVLEEFAPLPVPVQLVYPPSRLPAAKVRAFIDVAAAQLRQRLSPESR